GRRARGPRRPPPLGHSFHRGCPTPPSGQPSQRDRWIVPRGGHAATRRTRAQRRRRGAGGRCAGQGADLTAFGARRAIAKPRCSERSPAARTGIRPGFALKPAQNRQRHRRTPARSLFQDSDGCALVESECANAANIIARPADFGVAPCTLRETDRPPTHTMGLSVLPHPPYGPIGLTHPPYGPIGLTHPPYGPIGLTHPSYGPIGLTHPTPYRTITATSL